MITRAIVLSSMLLSITALATAQAPAKPAKPVATTISLAGVWRFQLDPQRVGVTQKWSARPLPDTIPLPGTTDEAKKGPANDNRLPNRLSRAYPYYGSAWYQRDIAIPKPWKGKRVTLTLERTKCTRVWLDDRDLGAQDSMTTAHVYDLGDKVELGRHTLTVMVENQRLPPIGGAHQASDETQTNWNGIIGRIELRATDAVWLEDACVTSDVAKRTALVRATLGSTTGLPSNGVLTVSAEAALGNLARVAAPVPVKFEFIKAGGTVEAVLPLGPDALTWDEFSPAIYKLRVALAAKSGDAVCTDTRSVDFGLRSFVAKGTQFQVNGRTIFLRGKHDACVFPLTGYPPMNKSGWLRVMRIAKSYGINHYRFHTWCPPDAAFAAADELGIYMQPELPNWGGFGAAEHDRYMLEEGKRMLTMFGNHPSFVMLSLGNEMGDRPDAMASTVAALRAYDPRRLYAQGSNNFFWNPVQAKGDDYWTTVRTGPGVMMVRGSFADADKPFGHVQSGPATTDADYSAAIKGFTIPVIGHEVGQYEVFPDLKEIPKYTGVLQPRNFEIIRDRLKARGMLDQADDFVRASGALAWRCYREDIELALRTPGFGGFQLLDLQDFPGQGTALVGVLNAFMESKGLGTPVEWREFCAPVVPLVRIPKYVWTADETFTATAEVANYGPFALTGAKTVWSLTDGKGIKLASGKLKAAAIPQGGVTSLGAIKFSLKGVKAPVQLTLALNVGKAVNRWPVWVYAPKVDTATPAGVVLARDLGRDTRAALKAGKTVVLIPNARDLSANVSLIGAFATDFWCWPMFRNNPGTMGLLIDDKHPALAQFPTAFHSDWQWFDLAMNARPVILDDMPTGYKPIVQVIDNFDRLHRLALVSEFKVGAGKLLLCAVDLPTMKDRPEARQLLASVLAYAGSPQFAPTYEMPASLIAALSAVNVALGKPVTASTAQGDCPASAAVDGNDATRWCAIDAKPHWLQVDLGVPVTLAGVSITWESPAHYRYLLEGSADGKAWGTLIDQRAASSDQPRYLSITTAAPIRYARITVLGGVNGQWASIRELSLLSTK